MKKLIILVFVIMFAFIYGAHIKVNASTNKIEELAKEYTNDDFYGDGLNICNYVTAWNGFDIGRGSGYGQRNVQKGSTYRFDDNDIVHIIPKDLFFNIGAYHYLGKEYGFYINTKLVNNGLNYRSYVVVYNITYTIPTIYENTTTCKIEMLFNCWYDNYFRGNNNYFGNSIIEGKDKVVTFLGIPTADNHLIELSDICVDVSLKNRDFPNPGDANYEFKDYVKNKLIDKGDFISSQFVRIKPKEMPINDDNDLNFYEKLIMYVCDKIIEETKILKPIKWLELLEKYVKKVYSNNNDFYSTKCDFGDSYEQLLLNKEYVRVVKTKSNSNNGSYNPHFHLGNYFYSSTTINGDTDSENRIAMILDYNIEVTINDPYNNTVLTASTKNEFSYSKYVKITETDGVYTETLDKQTGEMTFYYYSINTDELKFLVYSEKNVHTYVYNTEGTCVHNGSGNVTISNPLNDVYIIKVIGEKNTKITFIPRKNNSKFINFSINELKTINLQNDKTYLMFNTNNLEDSFYIFNFNCNDLNGSIIKIFDIYGNLIIDELEIIDDETYFYCYLEADTIYRIEFIKYISLNKELNFKVNNTISGEYNIGNYSSSTNQCITLSKNEIRMYKINCNYSKNYKIRVDSQDLFTYKLYDSQNNEIDLNNIEDSNSRKISINELSVGTYYLILFNGISTSNSISLYLTSRDSAYISYGNNDILLNSYNRVSNYYYANKLENGYYKFTINGIRLNGTTITYPENSIKVFNDSTRTILARKLDNNTGEYACTNYGENSFWIYLEQNRTYYLDINLYADDLCSLVVSITKPINQDINLKDVSNIVTYEMIPILINSCEKGDYVKEFKISQRGIFNFYINYSSDSLENVLVYIKKKVYDQETKSYIIETIFSTTMNKNNCNAEIEFTIFEDGDYYIGYQNLPNIGSISAGLRRFVDISIEEAYNTLVADPNSAMPCGSQVKVYEMNQREKSYKQTFITKNFTRIICIDDIYDAETSRLKYDWYSCDEEIATVSSFGTVLGKKVGTVLIIAILKEDPSKVYAKEFIIVEDRNTEPITVNDIYKVKYSQITNNKFHLNLEKVNCPYPWLQDYNWTIEMCEGSNILANMDYWGEITVNGTGCFILTGEYIKNSRVTIIIHVIIEE